MVLEQAPAGRSQAHPRLPLVGGIADAADIASLLQLLEDRRQRVGFQEQLPAERADALVARLRQGHHRDVLGVGQADRVQNPPLQNLPPFRYNPSLQIPRLRYSPGLAPTTRLNALLNAASDSSPTDRATPMS